MPAVSGWVPEFIPCYPKPTRREAQLAPRLAQHRTCSDYTNKTSQNLNLVLAEVRRATRTRPTSTDILVSTASTRFSQTVRKFPKRNGSFCIFIELCSEHLRNYETAQVRAPLGTRFEVSTAQERCVASTSPRPSTVMFRLCNHVPPQRSKSPPTRAPFIFS